MNGDGMSTIPFMTSPTSRAFANPRAGWDGGTLALPGGQLGADVAKGSQRPTTVKDRSGSRLDELVG